MRKLFFLLVFTMFLCSSAYAQDPIVGTVVNGQKPDGGFKFLQTDSNGILKTTVEGGISLGSASIAVDPTFNSVTGVASRAQLNASGALNVVVTNSTTSTPPFVTPTGVASSAQMDASGSLNVVVKNSTTTTPPFVSPTGVASSAQMDASGSLKVNLASGGANLGVSVLSGSVTITNNMGPTGVATDPITVTLPNLITSGGVASAGMLDSAGRQIVNIGSSTATLNANVTNGFGPTGFATDPVTVGINNAMGPTAYATDPAYIVDAYDYGAAGKSWLASAATDTPLVILSVATIATYPSLVVVSSSSDLWYSTLTTATAAWVLKSHKLTAGSQFTFKIKSATDRLSPVVIASSTGSVADVAIDVVALKGN